MVIETLRCVPSMRNYIILPFYTYRLDENCIVKVADFGLAKDIYETHYYRQHGRMSMPIKWMAIESLETGFFNDKTDVV